MNLWIKLLEFHIIILLLLFFFFFFIIISFIFNIRLRKESFFQGFYVNFSCSKANFHGYFYSKYWNQRTGGKIGFLKLRIWISFEIVNFNHRGLMLLFGFILFKLEIFLWVLLIYRLIFLVYLGCIGWIIGILCLGLGRKRRILVFRRGSFWLRCWILGLILSEIWIWGNLAAVLEWFGPPGL